MAAEKYWIWLQSRLKSGRTAAELLSYFRSPEEIFRAQAEELERLAFLNPHQKALLLDKDMRETDRILARADESSIRVIPYPDAAYPSMLRAIEEPPLVLYALGNVPDFDACLSLAVVGTRRSSYYGKNAAHTLGYRLGKAGVTVVTGMAAGIDAAASRGAMEAGGRCVAVLGTPVDVCYPQTSRDIYDFLTHNGLILSEYPPGSKTIPAHFPERNRIISGITRASILVEAPVKSGSLITARIALEQGKDIFAVPGNIDAPGFEGSNRLIVRGEAKAITRAADVLDEYRWTYDARFTREEAERSLAEVIQKQAPKKAVSGEEDMENKVTEALGNQGLSAEELADAIGVDTDELMTRLTVMEIMGKIKSDGGRYYAVR